MANVATASLVRLGKEKDLKLADSDQDIRGFKVLDKEGAEIAQVEDLLFDESEKKVRFLMVGSGGHGPAKIGKKKKSLIPVDAIAAIDQKTVTVDQSGADIIGAPDYDPEIVEVPKEYWDRVYGWYGYYPYWGPYYRYPHWGYWSPYTRP
ncbi:MAG: PRC-barrel domain-containing protein [Acidimicrobiia bacterium]|nr:PRC-barrel domain-containing protein [Acidimicrobiia bacterium]NNF08845.1 PRC-barrel domain-containing protein [Acidimicrobiia bacterium]NNL68899.1 PRC-barrel domain-containing protein [Acidimicrobiia bacterium]